ncbi:MAG: cell division protein PerM [Cellulomonadaceae bacterium]
MSGATGALAVLGRRGRVIDGTGEPARAAAWVSGALAAAQAVLLSFAVVAVVCVVSFVVTSADPSNLGTSWFSAVRVAATLWLLACGVPVSPGEATVTLVPLGLTLVLAFVGYASARRTCQPTWSALGAAAATYGLLGLVLALVSGAVTPPALVLAAAAPAVLGALATAAGARSERATLLDVAWAAVAARLPVAVRSGLRVATGAAAMLVAAATVVVLAWIFLGRTTSADVVRGLGVGGFDAVVLAVAQSTLAANLVAWASSWLAGPGFVIGSGSQFTASEVVVGPMPTLPIVGALPGAGSVSEAGVFVPALVVLCGVLGALLLGRRAAAPSAREVAAVSGTAGLGAGVLVGVLVALASGAAGPGRMAAVGAQPLLVTAFVALEVAAGAALVLTVRNPTVRRLARTHLDPRSWRRSGAPKPAPRRDPGPVPPPPAE